MKKHLFLLLSGLFILQGCALQVGVLNPHPDFEIKDTNKSIRLEIDDKIPNNFPVPEYSGIKNSKVTGWHSSLINGFNNGFKPFFTINNGELKSDYVLKILKTDIRFIPVSVNGYNTSTALKVQISFKATLIDNSGNEAESFSDTASSDKMIYHKGEEDEAVENAISIMYKIIANKFFNH